MGEAQLNELHSSLLELKHFCTFGRFSGCVLNFTTRQRNCAKAMFSQASVILSAWGSRAVPPPPVPYPHPQSHTLLPTYGGQIGRNVSYWNAFLLIKQFLELQHKMEVYPHLAFSVSNYKMNLLRVRLRNVWLFPHLQTEHRWNSSPGTHFIWVFSYFNWKLD